MILTGCVAFARHVGPTRVEAELLPQCWEQVSYPYGILSYFFFFKVHGEIHVNVNESITQHMVYLCK